MYGYEIEEILQSNLVPSNVFKGVFSSNELIKVKNYTYPAAFIVNTQPSFRSGEHWVAFYLKSPKALPEYFDSFGLAPVRKSFVKFLSRGNNNFRYNIRCLQSLFSSVCGEYTIYYVLQKSKGKTLQQLLSCFTDSQAKNDLLVHEFVKRLRKGKMNGKRKKLVRVRKGKAVKEGSSYQCSRCFL